MKACKTCTMTIPSKRTYCDVCWNSFRTWPRCSKGKICSDWAKTCVKCWLETVRADLTAFCKECEEPIPTGRTYCSDCWRSFDECPDCDKGKLTKSWMKKCGGCFHSSKN